MVPLFTRHKKQNQNGAFPAHSLRGSVHELEKRAARERQMRDIDDQMKHFMRRETKRLDAIQSDIDDQQRLKRHLIKF
ncbi:hypothetical protein L596_000094 [Steinernema carpocapsae]|uniref:Uncharacterized protein n=1 Tax=Steinernema carpocapsae TaxID=34508 RepID=A0A4U8UJJ7_STECR|nr:hypothetical protein L596_000094 [Steinernema carpocapsae]